MTQEQYTTLYNLFREYEINLSIADTRNLSVSRMQFLNFLSSLVKE